jgi:hypothetical protein
MQWQRTATDLKLIGEAIQPFALIFSVIAAVYTFAISERDKYLDRQVELSQPFYQKQLDLYTETSRVIARLATTHEGDPEHTTALARFWELYWGDLSLVESQPVDSLMADICKNYVSKKDPSRCVANEVAAAAHDFANENERELSERWVRR